MIHHIPGVLDSESIGKVLAYMEQADLVEGTETNANAKTKHNLQISQTDEGVAEISDLVCEALMANAQLVQSAFPKAMARPTFSRYEPGMKYGPHSDEPLIGSDPPIRGDVSCTVFLSDPDSYEGGELELWLGSLRAGVKYAAGDAVLYPTGAIHQVLPVTRGRRQVAVTWIQSYIADPQQRAVLVQYYEMMAQVAPGADAPTRVLLESVRTNLFRMWSAV